MEMYIWNHFFGAEGGKGVKNTSPLFLCVSISSMAFNLFSQNALGRVDGLKNAN